MKSIRSNKYTILLFVAVPMLIYVFFALIPILYNIYISLFDTNLLTPGKFVGLKNYARLLKDTTFLRALRNNIFLVIGSLAAHSRQLNNDMVADPLPHHHNNDTYERQVLIGKPYLLQISLPDKLQKCVEQTIVSVIYKRPNESNGYTAYHAGKEKH